MSDPDADDDVDQYAQLQPGDTLEYGGVADVLDEGYSPPERPWNCRDHESLDQRLADELPESWGDDADGDDGLGDTRGTDGELRDDEVGDTRAGRLTVDTVAGLAAGDAGVDGAGASAEEAAVHVIPTDPTISRVVEP